MDVTPFLHVKPAPCWLFEAAAQRADRPRFMVRRNKDWAPVTWRDWAGDVAAAAAGLGALGHLDRGERFGIYAGNSLAWATAALGGQSLGGVLVPVYPGCTAEQAAYVLEHAEARVVFVDGVELLERLLASWQALGAVRAIVPLGDLDAEAVRAGRAARGLPAPDAAWLAARLLSWPALLSRGRAHLDAQPGWLSARLSALANDDLGLMLYTSGTTGNPKGVPLTHGNLGHSGRDWIEGLASVIDDEPVDLLWLPFSHIFGFGALCLGNVLGMTTYLTGPGDVLADLPQVRPSVFFSVPSYWEKLAQQLTPLPPSDRKAKLATITGGRLRLCLSGGAGLKREIKKLFLAGGVLLLEGYGLTECSPTLTLNRPDAYDFSTVGRAVGSVQLRLAADGEIQARGPNVFTGYFKDPEATAGAFTSDGWFCTGDVGVLTPEGFLRIVDRKKDILVTAAGKNVPPANIEVRFRDDPLLAHVVVYGDGQRYLVAGVWLDAAEAERVLRAEAVPPARRETFLRELVARRIAAVNETLARHETIKEFALCEPALTVDNGFLTPSLKVKRKRVYEAFGPQLEALYQAGARHAG